MKFEKEYEKGVNIIIYEIPIGLSNKFVRLSQAYGFKKCYKNYLQNVKIHVRIF